MHLSLLNFIVHSVHVQYNVLYVDCHSKCEISYIEALLMHCYVRPTLLMDGLVCKKPSVQVSLPENEGNDFNLNIYIAMWSFC